MQEVRREGGEPAGPLQQDAAVFVVVKREQSRQQSESSPPERLKLCTNVVSLIRSSI